MGLTTVPPPRNLFDHQIAVAPRANLSHAQQSRAFQPGEERGILGRVVGLHFAEVFPAAPNLDVVVVVKDHARSAPAGISPRSPVEVEGVSFVYVDGGQKFDARIEGHRRRR